MSSFCVITDHWPWVIKIIYNFAGLVKKIYGNKKIGNSQNEISLRVLVDYKHVQVHS